ncbi:MAG: PAS domain S-box protein [Bacteroidetes bacterium]|nr:PAS domain S-box protein [Bacteroidota bacterium]
MGKTTEKLRAFTREGYLSNVIDKAPIGIITFSSDWKIDYINDSYLKFANIYNLKSKNLFGKNIISEFSDYDNKLINDIKSLADGNYFEREIKTNKGINNYSITLIVKGAPIWEQDQIAGGILLFEDSKIFLETQQKENLRSSYLQNFINAQDGYHLIADTSGNILYTFGTGLKDFYIDLSGNEKLTISVLNNFSDKFQPAINKLKKSKERVTFNFQSGDSILQTVINPFLDRREQIKLIFISIIDISDKITEKNRLKRDGEKLDAEKELFKEEKEKLNEQINKLKKQDEELNKNIEILNAEKKELLNYQHLVESVIDAVFTVDLKGKVIFWNKSSEELFGYTKSQIYNKFFGRVLGLFDLEYFEALIEELKENKSITKNITVYKNEGQKETIEAKFTFTGEEKDSVFIFCTNVTHWVNEYGKLKIEEEKYRNIVANTNRSICNIDKEGLFVYVNKIFCKSLYLTKDKILGKNINDFIDYDSFSSDNFNIKSLNENSITVTELPFLTGDKNKVKFIIKFHPILDDNLKVKYFNCYFTDITSKEAIDKELQLFSSIFNSSNDGIALIRDNNFELVNTSFANIFGYESGKDLLGLNFLSLTDEKDSKKVGEYLKLIKGGDKLYTKFEFLARQKDKANFYCEASASVFDVNNIKYLVIIARDITEKKRSQEIIKRSEEKFRNITENIDDFLYTFEKIGKSLRPVFYTASVEKITHYTQDDFLNDGKMLLKIIHPDDFADVKKKMRNLFKSRIQVSGEIEFRIISKFGNVVWVRNKLNIVRNSKGEIQKLYGLVTDISLRKKAELELKKSSDKLVKLNETKDRFIEIISHDLRTPFSSVVGFTDLLLNDKELNEEEKTQYIKYIQESANSMLALVNSLLDWTRLQTGRVRFEPDRCNIKEIINSSISLMSGVALQKNIKLVEKIDEDTNVFIDKDLIQQVFNNLLSNAIKFTNEDGEIIISKRPFDKSRFIEFSVKDNGIGIKEENIDKLFNVDTKYTSEGTKGEKGSGLGLSLVKEIIIKHGGDIRAESIYGLGTEFIFTLPVASENILLVDNNKTDLILYTKILNNITPDYKIIVVSNGKEALDFILTNTPALVITENDMPELNGYNLIKEINKSELKIKPPFIVLSCNIDKYAINDYEELGVKYIFRKPVNLRELKSAIEKSLADILDDI